MSRNNKSKKHHNNISLEKIIVSVFLVSLVFYLISITFIQGYNVELQRQEQKLAKQIKDKREQIDQLQIEINDMLEKSRVVSLLGDDIQDNSDNIYIISE